jgi:hypothetical protein
MMNVLYCTYIEHLTSIVRMNGSTVRRSLQFYHARTVKSL